MSPSASQELIDECRLKRSAPWGADKGWPLFKVGLASCIAMGHEQARTDRRGVAAPGPLLPLQRPVTGRPARDHRTMINAMLWLTKTGKPWRDLPERYGPWRTVATRFYHWTKSGLWQRILAELQRAGDAEGRLDWSVHMVDGTSIRAHRHAAGAKGAGKSGARPLAPGRLLTAAAALTDDRLLPIMASAASCICAASGAANHRLRPDRRRAPRADGVRALDGGRGRRGAPAKAAHAAASGPARRPRLYRPTGTRRSGAAASRRSSHNSPPRPDHA